MAHKHN